MNVLPDHDDSDRVLPFDDNDMKLMKVNLRKLSEQDQLLVRVLAASACAVMRRPQSTAKRRKPVAAMQLSGARPNVIAPRPVPVAHCGASTKKIGGPLFTCRKDNAGPRIGK